MTIIIFNIIYSLLFNKKTYICYLNVRWRPDLNGVNKVGQASPEKHVVLKGQPPFLNRGQLIRTKTNAINVTKERTTKRYHYYRIFFIISSRGTTRDQR